MIAMRVVEVPVHQIIDVVAVGYSKMAAVRPVHMISRVSGARVLGRAAIGIRRRDGNHVLIHMVGMDMV